MFLRVSKSIATHRYTYIIDIGMVCVLSLSLTEKIYSYLQGQFYNINSNIISPFAIRLL